MKNVNGFDEELVRRIKSNKILSKFFNSLLRKIPNLDVITNANLGELADLYYIACHYIDIKQSEIRALQQKVEVLANYIANKMAELGISEVSGSFNRIKKNMIEHINIKDWNKLKGYIISNNLLELLQKRVTKTVAMAVINELIPKFGDKNKVCEELGLEIYEAPSLVNYRINIKEV